jgi:probable phosphoglycerate mutase
VLLVRHGTTPSTGKVLPGRARGLHLSEAGVRQAEAAAGRIAAWGDKRTGHAKTRRGGSARGSSASPKPEHVEGISAVYSSPLERTRETAAPIARALGLAVQTDRGLLECDFGDWTGAELKRLSRLPEWATVQRYPSGFTFPGGESFVAMQARIVSAISSLRARHPGQAVVAVSHADPIKAAVADALGSHLDLFQRIAISPCSVTAIAYGDLGPSVLTVNSMSDLSDLAPS